MLIWAVNQYTFEVTLPSSHLNYRHQPAIIFKDHHNEFYNIPQSKCAGLCKDSEDTEDHQNSSLCIMNDKISIFNQSMLHFAFVSFGKIKSKNPQKNIYALPSTTFIIIKSCLIRL